jgi:DNA-binding transcriptional MerR regulator
MTDATATMAIGELARRTGLPVRTIRFYSDSGVLPPAGRAESGYRRYGPDAPARLELIRTLRDLGIDLATIRRLLDREVTVPDVAAAHVAALDAQIRVLEVQRAVLAAVARRESDPQEMQRMHELARLSADERRRIVADFIDEAFAGLDIEPGFAERMRSATPELPDDPTPEQVDAWIELAGLVRDPGFKETIRRMSEGHAAARASGEPAGGPPAQDWQAAATLVAERAGRAREQGSRPGTPEAEQVVGEIAPAFGTDPADRTARAALADRLAQGTDARAERYWQLLAVINGWPPVPTTVPAWEWLIAALRQTPGG